MSIDKRILAKRLHRFINKYYHAVDKEIILRLVEIIVYHCPQLNCLVKGKKSNWDGLPHSKSLFYAGKYRGLPIGNLSSQVFANFYMDAFDKFVKNVLKVKYYGRYVDDFVIVHEDKEFLVRIQEKMRNFMQKELHLRLHPKKFICSIFQKALNLSAPSSSRGAFISETAPKGTYIKNCASII